MGSEIDVAFFWTNILMRSSLSDGIALSPTFLGQSVSLNTASLQISHLEMKKENAFLICKKYFLSAVKTWLHVHTLHILGSFPQ